MPSKNVLLIGIGLLVMVLGFVLMLGGGSSDPNVFNPEMLSGRSIVVAPVVICIGIGVIVWGIMRKPRNENEQ